MTTETYFYSIKGVEMLLSIITMLSILKMFINEIRELRNLNKNTNKNE